MYVLNEDSSNCDYYMLKHPFTCFVVNFSGKHRPIMYGQALPVVIDGEICSIDKERFINKMEEWNVKLETVRKVNEKDSDGSPKTIQTDDGSNKIIRVLSKEEQADVIKSIQLQTEAEKEREKQKKQKIAQENSLGNEYMNGLKKEREAENGFSSVDLSAFD